jgi:hypothetical protein
MKPNQKYRPKADYQLLRDLINEAWQSYHDKHFSEASQAAIGEKLVALLERQFPQDDMNVLAKYNLADTPKSASINIYAPERQRWDVYASLPLPRPVLTPQGRASFFVGGPDLIRGDHLGKEFEPYFDKVREARAAWAAESRFKPVRGEAGYPTWKEIAEQLPVAGSFILGSF